MKPGYFSLPQLRLMLAALAAFALAGCASFSKDGGFDTV